MAAQQKLTKAQQKSIAKKYAKGAPLKDLTEEYGVAVGTIRAAVVRQGGTLRPVGRPRKS